MRRLLKPIIESFQNYKRNQKFCILIGICFFIFSIFLIFFLSKNLRDFLSPREKSFSVANVFSSIKNEFYESNSEYPIIVGDKVVDWEELDRVLEFEKMLWEDRSTDWQIQALISEGGYEYEKEEIISLLLERKIIEQIAKNYNISDLTDSEIENAKISFFGKNYKELIFNSHLEMEARARTRAFKEKIDQELVKRYTGILVYIKFKSWGATDLNDAEAMARKKAEELYEQAKVLETDSLAELANNDPEIILLNDGALAEVFHNSSLDDFCIPSPEIEETIKDLTGGQVSQVFELTAVMDPTLDQYQSFAYGFLKIDNVSGSVENLEDLIQNTKDGLKIEININ